MPYLMSFDSSTEKLRELTQEEEHQVKFFNHQSTNARKNDNKTALVTYTVIRKGKTNEKLVESSKSSI